MTGERHKDNPHRFVGTLKEGRKTTVIIWDAKEEGLSASLRALPPPAQTPNEAFSGYQN